MRLRARLGCLALAILAAVLPGAAAAQSMVIRGSSSHPAGQRLSPQAEVMLAQGERLLILVRGAGTRLVCGPYRGSLAAAQTSCSAAAVAESRQVIMAARGRGGFDSLFDILDGIGSPEPVPFCVNPDAFLTDHDFGENVQAVLIGEGARQRRVRWPARQTNFRLRPHVRPRDGLLVTVLYGEERIRLRLRIMPTPLLPNTRVRLDQEAMTVADMLHDLGCTRQEAEWMRYLEIYLSQNRPFVPFDP